MAGRAIAPELLERAADMLKDPNVSYASVSKETGISTDTLSRRFPRDKRPGSPGRPPASAPAPEPPRFDDGPAKQSDPRPGGRRSTSSSSSSSRRSRRVESGPSDRELEGLVRKLAMSPAFLTKTVVRCDYCTMHFIESAPEVASELMELAQDNPDLREAMEWMWREWRKFAWASALGGWIGIPLAHHLMPERWYGLLVLLAGMPPRETTSSHDAHRHAHPSGSTPFTPPAPAPAPNGHPADIAVELELEATGPAPVDLGQMSISELLDQAQGMGIDLAAFGISQDDVANLLRGGGDNGAVDVAAATADHPARNDDDEGHDAGTPIEFIETDPAALDATLAELDAIEPDPAHSAQADEAAALAADPNPDERTT